MAGDAVTAGAIVVSLVPTLVRTLLAFIRTRFLDQSEGNSFKVTASFGDKSIDAEFPPGTMTNEEIAKFSKALMNALENADGS